MRGDASGARDRQLSGPRSNLAPTLTSLSTPKANRHFPRPPQCLQDDPGSGLTCETGDLGRWLEKHRVRTKVSDVIGTLSLGHAGSQAKVPGSGATRRASSYCWHIWRSPAAKACSKSAVALER